MSHYAVAVFTKEGQSLEELMEPFYEGIEVEPYIAKTKQEIIQEAKDLKESISKRLEENKLEPSDWQQEILDCKTDEEFYQANIYEDEEYDEEGNRLSTYNPDSKWDWYEVGGRWSNMLTTIDGEKVDKCLIKHLNLTPDKESYDKAIRFWELVVEEQPLKEGEKMPFNMYRKEYFINRYETKENYANIQSQLCTYAVLMPNGEWFEPGKMGWWGVSLSEMDAQKEWDKNYHKFFEQAEDDWTVTIVDCHI